MTCMTAGMGTVTVVHENMHQWAGEEQEEWQHADEMGAVLACQEVCRDGTYDEQAHCVT
jgi:hypothetical protein